MAKTLRPADEKILEYARLLQTYRNLEYVGYITKDEYLATKTALDKMYKIVDKEIAV